MDKKERFQKVIEWFQTNMPIAETELDYRTPFELLVAVILSAQCTDKRVNMVTPALFERFPTVEKMAEAEVPEIFEYIRSISFPNNKAKYLVGMAQMLQNEYESQVPNTVTELVKLPGVGRKTANVIVSVIFDKPAMAVDTHVFRVSERIGLSYRSKTPLETEKQLIKYIPEELLPIAHHWLILHGRYTCVARKPKCEHCGLQLWCKKYAREHKKEC
ncbi:endonuclease III [Halosquirtibacter laminarini]|uniref:Endonuclease III n=1 Tax=Halosquirtibacter laminarini TaxID=3374600 RepID=A0AC61NF72_9BACT|nr:endonuclease III [Prolixibacteraceae bacterium]